MRIVAFPSSGPYPDALYKEVRARGVQIVAGTFTWGAIHRDLRSGDVAHLHWPSYLYAEGVNRIQILANVMRFLFLLVLIRLRGARIAWTAHNLYPHEPTPLPYADVLVRRTLIALSSVIFVHGCAARDVLTREFRSAASKVALITHGHWVGKYSGTDDRLTARKMLELPASDFVYLFFGMCRPYKNLEVLIDTFAALPASGTLLIAGKFQTQAYRQRITDKLASLGESRIRLVAEHIPDHEVHRFFAAADCAVLPYRDTLTSGAAVLAMSLGVPVIAPSRGFLVDLVSTDCGMLYSFEQPDGLSRAMSDIRQRTFSRSRIIDTVSKHRWEDSADVTVDALFGVGGASDTAITLPPNRS